MTYLLDTHALIWYIGGDKKLSTHARALIDDEENDLFVSNATLWEMAIKFSLGKLDLGKPFAEMFPHQLEINSINILTITVDHLKAVTKLPFHHRDPFDRLIIAQSQVEKLPIISVDSLFDEYNIDREW